MRADARKEDFEYVEVFGKPALFTDERLSRFTVPEGWYCYDLRGRDDDPGDPGTIERRVSVNHAGTILTPTEIPFEEGKTFVEVDEALDFVGGEDMTLEEFCTEHGLEYPRETRKYVPRPASPSEVGLFYAQQPEQDKLLGGIGHLRMDFGRGGDGFWTSWFDHGSGELNTPEFKTEIDEVVNELRQTVLKDRATMRSFCADLGGELGESWGMMQYGYLTRSAGQGNAYAQYFLDHRNDWQSASVGSAVLRMLHHMSRIFQDNDVADSTYRGLQIDKKRRQAMRDKRIAMGHKPDDHELQDQQQTMR